MTKPKLWEKLHLSQWGEVKAMADHLGFKVQRLRGDRCQLLMPRIKADDIIMDIEFTDSLTNIQLSLRQAVEEVIDQRFKLPEKKQGTA